MSTTTKVLEGVRLTDALKECLVEAQRRAKDMPSEPLGTVSSAKRSSLLSPMTLQQARSQLAEYQQEKKENLPVAILRAMSLVLGDERVEHALATGSQQLAFTPMIPHDPDTPQQQKWKQRMQRLALLQEERSYSKLTTNIGKVVQDDVTVRSMTYAASIGLNMIVAPISFGVFMYFFAGGIIDFLWKQPKNAHVAASTVDNRKVICGVISGVVMLMVEMILFVIRTHEMDKAMRKKQKKSKAIKPFGPYSSASAKTFKGE